MTGAPDQVNRDTLAEAHTPVICVRVDRAIRILDIGKTKLYDLIAAGELEAIRIGRRTLIMQASIDALIQRLRLQETERRPSSSS